MTCAFRYGMQCGNHCGSSGPDRALGFLQSFLPKGLCLLLAISRTSSNARRSSPAGICARKPFRLVEHNTADSGDGTVYEHNYSRMNEGGCVMFCLEEAIHNTFRGNVSYDDLGGTISPSQNPDALLEHNTFYLRDGVPFVRARMDGGSYTEKDDTILPLP